MLPMLGLCLTGPGFAGHGTTQVTAVGALISLVFPGEVGLGEDAKARAKKMYLLIPEGGTWGRNLDDPIR